MRLTCAPTLPVDIGRRHQKIRVSPMVRYHHIGAQVLQVGKGARVASIMSLGEFSDDDFLVMLTKDGLIKRTPMKLFANVRGSLTAIKLRVGSVSCQKFPVYKEEDKM